MKLPIEGLRSPVKVLRSLDILVGAGAGSASLKPTKIVAIGVNYRLHAQEMGGVGPLTPGDRVEVEIEDVGVLANPVVEATSPG